MLFDLHVHTDISPCSSLELTTILTRAKGLGLDGVCLTDHDTMEVLSEVKEGVQNDGLVVIVGMEYSTPEGDYLIFGPFESIRPGMNAFELAAHVYRAGGAMIGAHPYRLTRPADLAAYGPEGCRIVEVANGRNTRSENARALSLAEKHSLAMSAGSDAHTLEELGRLPSKMLTKVHSREDFVAALRNGLFRPSRLACANGLPHLQVA
ncbi:PHP domain-containing protein [Salidesulfovibrio brasiliensis]|uniref:PHP domain-containing protein n=1 Tax=Salidesulfovibrio brasiliensis TaxID=221711 RepID=UPI0006D0A77C|nr:PHP domain-containing protein [Salidesulfovibrio brasiliensis]